MKNMRHYVKMGVFFFALITLLVACDTKPTFQDGIREGYANGYSNGFSDGIDEIATKVFINDSVNIFCDSLISVTGIYIGKVLPDTSIIRAAVTIIIPDSTTQLKINGGHYYNFNSGMIFSN